MESSQVGSGWVVKVRVGPGGMCPLSHARALSPSLALQLLQLRRSGPPRQGVRPAPPAKEMPLLPEHHTHGGAVSPQDAGALRLSGPTRLVYLGLRPRDRPLSLPAGGGGAALGLLPAGRLLLLARGTPHAWPPDAEVEKILKSTGSEGQPTPFRLARPPNLSPRPLPTPTLHSIKDS